MSPPHRPQQFQSMAVAFDESALSDTEEPFENHDGQHPQHDHESTLDHIVDGLARRLSVEAAAGPANLYRPRTGSNASRPGSFTSTRSHRRSQSSLYPRHSHHSHRDRSSSSSQQERVRWHSLVHDRPDRLLSGPHLTLPRSSHEHLPRIESEKTLARSDSDLSSKCSSTTRKGSGDVAKDIVCLPELPASAVTESDLECDSSSSWSKESVSELSKTRKIILGIVVMFCLFISVS